MSLRLGGAAAPAGGALWLAALAVTVVDNTGGGTFWLPVVASVALLIGLAGLSAFQAREHPVLIWAAFTLPAIGALLMILGMAMLAAVGDRPIAPGIHPWAFVMFGLLATIVGSALFALATWRTATLPRSGAAFLGIASVISLAALFAKSGLGDTILTRLAAVKLGAFAVGWIVVGLQAIRLDRRVAITGAV